MSFLRHLSTWTSPIRARPLLRTRYAAFTTTSHSLAFSDYGSGAGDPRGENPQSQGINASADVEHPGPPPPTAGKGSGAGPTKGGDKQSHAPASSKTDSGEIQGSQKDPTPTRDAHPTILNESPSKEGKWSKEVREHNREIDSLGLQFDRRPEKEHGKDSDA